MVTNRSLVTVVQALIELAQSPRGMATSAEIASVVDAHPVVLRRLLGTLRASGIVQSRTGPKGGWTIARDPESITVGSIQRALADEAEMVTPLALDEALRAAESAFLAQLESVTLASLMA